ncbi:hypothetical protein QTG54_013949 [Skeletonema marinoi]|uniref:Uncharacterized protein n=1 Tax=Skeletonema marinoi TaxID=267567 RepID=A0AAD8XXG0_9STRA|nr:hypothetical protein QTG54_013949 [Skeletonema marinoi]
MYALMVGHFTPPDQSQFSPPSYNVIPTDLQW